MYKAGVALNRKSVLPLFSTTKVCRKKEKERESYTVLQEQSIDNLF